MSTTRGSSARRVVVSLVLTATLFGAAAWTFLNRQYIVDQMAVWQYQPSQAVRQLTDRSGMNDNGRFYFYAAAPRLDGTSAFNKECRRQEENSAILGCYSGGKIFIYDIKDTRLDGVRSVTAAHEMLHVAYSRLSDHDRRQLTDMLDAEYQKLRTTGDEAFRSRMEYYARTEPGERDNELHSIIGTEVAELPPALENYYARYFADRQKVVALHGSYNSKFAELKQNSTTLRTELEQLSSEINQMTSSYNNDITALNNDISAFNARAENGQFGSQAEFAAARSALVERVNKLKQTRATIDARAADYETKRQAYNKTVDESNSLSRSLDSSLAPAPSI